MGITVQVSLTTAVYRNRMAGQLCGGLAQDIPPAKTTVSSALSRYCSNCLSGVPEQVKPRRYVSFITFFKRHAYKPSLPLVGMELPKKRMS
jgi:hypothetical protein